VAADCIAVLGISPPPELAVARCETGLTARGGSVA